MLRFALLCAAAFALVSVEGHGALIQPPARNALDRFLPQWKGGAAPKGSNSCNCGNQQGCDQGVRASGGGQPCLWFSQGCNIGCPNCTGIGSHTAKSLCDSPMEPTLPKEAWTMSRWAKEGSANDTYRYNPWRAPGYAPVNDPCGMAGGTLRKNAGPGEAIFADNQFAKMGDLGSKVLPPAPSGTVWTSGTSVEVAWGIRYNHGGGYSYRLCSANQNLTEECMKKTPLDFDRTKQALQWKNGTRYPIKGTFVDQGTSPPGSTWAMNPIPRIDFDAHSSGQPAGYRINCSYDGKGSGGGVHGTGCRQFDPPCPWDDGWYAQPPAKASVDVEGACSGDWTGGLILDTVLIPKDLPPGDYVLGFRWDCEESDQVWSSCADVTIIAPQQA